MPQNSPTRPTIVDVAREAGVSHSTVSRVLNSKAHVKESTRKRVQKAADNLGYVANVQARRLAGGKTGVIGVVALDLASSYITTMVRAVDIALADNDLALMLCTTHRREEHEKAYVSQLSMGLVDGLILLVPLLEPATVIQYTQDLRASNMPFVLLDHLSTPDAYAISSDNRRGTRMAVEHLAELGHRRIAIITGELDTDVGRERLASFREAQRDLGADLDDDLIVRGDFSAEAGYRAMQQLLALTSHPTAVFTSSDAAAIGAMRALDEQNVSVPDEMSVVGFDDIPEASAAPTLTTIRQPVDRMAHEAIQMLRRQIDQNERAPVYLSLPVELVVRATTAPPAGSAN